MSASIMVLDHPYFAVPQLDGSFTLPTCRPAGTRSSAGTSASANAPRTIEVESGRDRAIELSLPGRGDR